MLHFIITPYSSWHKSSLIPSLSLCFKILLFPIHPVQHLNNLSKISNKCSILLCIPDRSQKNAQIYFYNLWWRAFVMVYKKLKRHRLEISFWVHIFICYISVFITQKIFWRRNTFFPHDSRQGVYALVIEHWHGSISMKIVYYLFILPYAQHHLHKLWAMYAPIFTLGLNPDRFRYRVKC